MRWTAAGSLLAALAAFTTAQDIDTAVIGRNGSRGSVLDQIEDEGERRDFLQLFRAKAARRRRELADAFLSGHPTSWLLPEAYEIGAKASIELGDFPAAVRDARASLRFLPENPALLVPLANVQVQLKQFRGAEENARAALEYLDLFAGPATESDAESRTTSNTLRASAYFALGRALASEALAGNARSRAGKLNEAAEALNQGLQLNPADREISRLRHVVMDQGGRAPAPRRDRSWSEESSSYAGSAQCEPCHKQIFAAWKRSGMARMLRPFDSSHALADFSSQADYTEGAGSAAVHIRPGDPPVFEFADGNGRTHSFPVHYTIGSKWQQAYATRLKDGRIFVFPIQYNRLRNRWLNYWKLIDPAGSERAQIGAFPHLTPATNYQRNCAICHASALKFTSARDEAYERAIFREPGVACEMCHGPSARHVKMMQTGRSYEKTAEDPPFGLRRMDHREAVMVCGQCHRQSALRDAGPHGEINFLTKPPFYKRLRSRPYVEFGRRAFYKDGRFRETTFIGEAFMRSGCFRKGNAQCAHCHNPHSSDAGDNPVSLKWRDNPDQMCLQCHSELSGRIAEHTHHAVTSPGSRCAACHMPPIMNSLLFLAASHQIDDVPNADMTARFGQRDSPNACLICHTGEDVKWVAERLQSW